MPATMTCAAKPTMHDVDLNKDDLYLKAGQLQMDLAVAALACDQTRILTFQWSYSESEHLFAFLNISGNHHAISHDFSSSGDELRRVQQDPDLVRAAVPLPAAEDGLVQGRDRSLLDNSIVLWATEIGESTQHDLTMMPYVLAGSAGGKIRAGRFIDYGTHQSDNNQMLVSIAQAMGASDLTSFGDASGATGPLPISPRRGGGGRAQPEGLEAMAHLAGDLVVRGAGLRRQGTCDCAGTLATGGVEAGPARLEGRWAVHLAARIGGDRLEHEGTGPEGDRIVHLVGDRDQNPHRIGSDSAVAIGPRGVYTIPPSSGPP